MVPIIKTKWEDPTEDGIIHGQTNQLYDNTPNFIVRKMVNLLGISGDTKQMACSRTNEITDWIAAGNGVLRMT